MQGPDSPGPGLQFSPASLSLKKIRSQRGVCLISSFPSIIVFIHFSFFGLQTPFGSPQNVRALLFLPPFRRGDVRDLPCLRNNYVQLDLAICRYIACGGNCRLPSLPAPAGLLAGALSRPARSLSSSFPLDFVFDGVIRCRAAFSPRFAPRCSPASI